MKKEILNQNENSWDAIADDFFAVTALPKLGCSVPKRMSFIYFLI